MNLPFAQNGKALRLTFEGWPLTDDQFAVVKDEQKKILAFIPVPKAGEYSVVIPPRKGSQVDKLVLRFEFPQARRPNNGDQRVLSFFFRSIKLSQADGK